MVVAAIGGLALTGCTDDVTPAPDTGSADSGVGTDTGIDPDTGIEPDTGTIIDDAGPGEVCDEDATLGQFCVYDADCNDLCYCNGNEVCQGGVCARGRAACDDGVECTVDVCDEETFACENGADDATCDDGNICTGTEVCDLDVGCIAGLPLNCSDGDSCTLDSCDPDAGCTNILRDLDGDGFADSRCAGGDDCDDDPLSGSTINPSALELCDDGVDNNCDGIADIFDEDACSPTNGTCASAIHLESPGIYNFSTRGLEDDYELSCETGTGNPDAVFTFSLGTIRDVIVSIPGAPMNTAIELRSLSDCELGEGTVYCDRDTSSYSDEAIIERSALEAGDYAVIITSPMGGFFSLALEINSPVPPPRNDLCDAMTPVISSSMAISGDFTVLADDYASLDCHSYVPSTPLADAAYRISLPVPTDITITSDGISSYGGRTNVAVALVRDCADASGTALACEPSSYSAESTINFVPLPAGDYFLLLEPSTSAVGYQIDVDMAVPLPPIDGDNCGNAIDVTSAPASVDIARLRNDGGLGCGGTSLAYRDATVYFDVAAASDVVLTTNAPVFHLYAASTDCADTTSEFVCQPSSATGTGSTTLTDLTPGRYFVNVSVPSDMGTLDVSTTITPR